MSVEISYPLDVPDHNFRRVRWVPFTNVGTSSGTYDYKSQTQVYSGQSWAFDIDLPTKTPDDARDWIAFFLMMNGRQGTCRLAMPGFTTQRGNKAGTGTVKGANQTGMFLFTDGWTINTQDVLRAGDFLEAGQRMYTVLKDVDSDGAGEATLTLWPSIISSPGDNEVLIYDSPKSSYRLAKNVMPWEQDTDLNIDFSFSVIEAI